jgi:hypothetical protein
MRRVCSGLALFVGGIILSSAFLAPWIFWVVEFFFPGEIPFRRVFNRVLMVSALVFLWPLARYWKVQSWTTLGLTHFSEGRKDWLSWLGWGCLSVGVLFLAQIIWADRVWTGQASAGRTLEFAFSALMIGVLEEVLFRGMFFWVLLRWAHGLISRSVMIAVLTSIFFATTHYLKAVNPSADVDWLSGWWAWGSMLLELGDARMLALRWVTLFLVGLVLCALAYQRGSLWAGMGLHTGWVFTLKMFNQATDWTGVNGSWWFQRDILSGGSAELLLLVMLVLILCWGKRKELLK